MYKKIRQLNSEKEDLLNKINFEKQRFDRIKFLLNTRVHTKSKCFIEETKKEYNILTAINETRTEFEIEIFDLDNIEYNSNRTLVLWAKKREYEIYIQDVQGGNGYGHGEIAMNHLFKHAKNNSIPRIVGNLSSDDYDHKERLLAYYTKLGFEIEDGNKGNEKIQKHITF